MFDNLFNNVRTKNTLLSCERISLMTKSNYQDEFPSRNKITKHNGVVR